jgi:hypothetical protein
MVGRPTSKPLLGLLILCSAGCGGEDAGAHLVVGLTTDMAVGFDIRRVETTSKVNGILTHAESLSYSKGKLSLPATLPIQPAQDEAEVELSVAAFRDGEASPIVTRRAVTRAVDGRTLLLPVSLAEACSAIPCAEGATCVEGACLDPFIDPSALADYDPMWIKSAPDACKTPSSGDPAIEVGQGSSAFAPLENDEVVAIEAGPQGGHHVWLALRVTGLRQLGSQLTIGGYYPDLAFDLLPFSSRVTLRKAGDGHCEIYGVRFQVDRDISVATVRGRALDIDVILEDPSGDIAKASKRVVIAP